MVSMTEKNPESLNSTRWFVNPISKGWLYLVANCFCFVRKFLFSGLCPLFSFQGFFSSSNPRNWLPWVVRERFLAGWEIRESLWSCWCTSPCRWNTCIPEKERDLKILLSYLAPFCQTHILVLILLTLKFPINNPSS